MPLRHAFALPLLLAAAPAFADPLPSFELTLRNHQFTPAELTVPAGRKLRLVVRNLDASMEEFDSYDLDREVNIEGGRQAEIFVGPLKAGRYAFMGEMHRKSARGVLIVR